MIEVVQSGPSGYQVGYYLFIYLERIPAVIKRVKAGGGKRRLLSVLIAMGLPAQLEGKVCGL